MTFWVDSHSAIGDVGDLFQVTICYVRTNDLLDSQLGPPLFKNNAVGISFYGEAVLEGYLGECRSGDTGFFYFTARINNSVME